MKNILITILCFFFLVTQAQEKHLYISFGPSPVSYKGELSNKYSKWGVSGNISLSTSKGNFLHNELELSKGYFSGQSSSENPSFTNDFFKTSFVSVNYALHFNILRKKKINISLSPGIGIFRFTPFDSNGNKHTLPEEQGNTSIMLPLKISSEYVFTNNYRIGISARWMSPQTDALDNVVKKGTKNDKIVQFYFFIKIPLMKMKQNTTSKKTL